MLQIHLTDEVISWFKEEFSLQKGDHVRFYARYGGSSPIQEGFSLGVNKEDPIETGIKTETDGIIFFIEEHDLWYFKDYDLYVDYDATAEGPVYDYKKTAM